MKKRFVCLLLCAVMVLLCFAGCAEKDKGEVMEDIGEEASKDAVTLSMYLMSEQPVSAVQEALMEEKVNEITKTKFNIKIDLRYFTPDTYYTELELDLAEMKAFYDGGAEGKIEETPVYTDENGLPAVYYPPIEEFDVDIFYFAGYDKYATYKEAGYLKDLKEQVEGSSKALKAVINNTLFSSFRDVTGGTYAIPTNRQIGEYTYMLFHKDILKKTQYSTKDFTSLTCANAQDILKLVEDNYSDEFVPLYSATGELDLIGVQYYGADQNGLLTNKFSILGGTYNPTWDYGVLDLYPTIGSVTASADVGGNGGFVTQVRTLKQYEFDGYYAEEGEEDKPFAVGYVKGSAADIAKYSDDYEVTIVQYPTLQTEDLFESMFAVSEYTNSIAGSAEIITFLNTDTEFRNLLLYGVEGENYTWEDSDILDSTGAPYRVVARQTKDEEKLYVMDALKTGNVALAYDEMGQNPIANANIFNHNADLKKDLILGFSYYDSIKNGKLSGENLNHLLVLGEASDAAYEKLVAAATPEELTAALAEINAVAATTSMAAAVGERKRDRPTPVACYLNWLVGKGLWEPGMDE